MRLVKAVCEKCRNTRSKRGRAVWDWVNQDETYWRDGLLWCPAMNPASAQFWTRESGVPKTCPYAVEHAVSQ